MADRQEVVIKDIEMSFGSMVIFIIKWTLASIPALIVLLLVGVLFSVVFGSLFRAFMP